MGNTVNRLCRGLVNGLASAMLFGSLIGDVRGEPPRESARPSNRDPVKQRDKSAAKPSNRVPVKQQDKGAAEPSELDSSEGHGSFGSLTSDGSLTSGFPPNSGFIDPAAVGAVTVTPPIIRGGLHADVITRHFRRNHSKLLYCYEKELLIKPTLSGTVKVEFIVNPSGKASPPATAGVDPEVAKCVAAVFENIEWPKPRGGGSARVKCALIYRQERRKQAR